MSGVKVRLTPAAIAAPHCASSKADLALCMHTRAEEHADVKGKRVEKCDAYQGGLGGG